MVGNKITEGSTASTAYVSAVCENIVIGPSGALILDSSFSVIVIPATPDAVGNVHLRLVIDPGAPGEIVVGEAVTDEASLNDSETEIGAIISGDPIPVAAGPHTVCLQWRVQTIGGATVQISNPGHATVRATEIGI